MFAKQCSNNCAMQIRANACFLVCWSVFVLFIMICLLLLLFDPLLFVYLECACALLFIVCWFVFCFWASCLLYVVAFAVSVCLKSVSRVCCCFSCFDKFLVC